MDEITLHRKARLRDLIAQAPYNGSQKAFGEAVGITAGRVSQLVDPAHSFGERAAHKIASELRLDDRYFELGYLPEAEFVQVRRVDVKFSNGTGRVVYFEDDKPPLSFRADFLRRMGIAPGNAVVVDADGDSNSPKIQPGSVVLVDRGDKTKLNGDFFAFRDNDELLIKRLSILDNIGVLATAENPDFKPKMKVYTDPDGLEIIGRCKWTGIEL